MRDGRRRHKGRQDARRIRWLSAAVAALSEVRPDLVVACPWSIRPRGCDPDCVCGRTGRATAAALIQRYRGMIADAEDRLRA